MGVRGQLQHPVFLCLYFAAPGLGGEWPGFVDNFKSAGCRWSGRAEVLVPGGLGWVSGDTCSPGEKR